MDKLYPNIKVVQLLNPINSTTTRTSSYVDTQGFSSKLLIANIGFSLDTLSGSRYWTIQLLEGEDTSTFTSVADSDTQNGASSFVIDSASLDEAAYVFAYQGSKRYLRASITATGTHNIGTPMGVTAILGAANVSPVS